MVRKRTDAKETRLRAIQPKRPQKSCRFYRRIATNLSISSSQNKSNKIGLVATTY